MDWITENYIEIIGVVSALLFLYFEFRESAWLWPLGIVSSTFYCFIFYQAKIYADMGLQVYFVAISIYGWFAWLRKKDSVKDLQIRSVRSVLALKLSVVFLVLFGALYLLLSEYTDSPIPLGDAFTSALSIIASWMLSRKLLEQWWLWVVVNFTSVGLYFYRGIELTALLYIIYGIVAVAGYYEWKKKMNRS